jgi:hypothetical protein
VSLRARPETEALGRLAGGIAAYARGFRELAWAELRPLAPERWAEFAPAEYARSGLATEPEAARAALRRLVDEDPAGVPARSWYELVTAVWGYGDGDLARALFERFDRRVREGAQGWREGEHRRDWLRPWIALDPDSATAPGSGRRTFAVMDYGHPSPTKASANIGDHIQSIASLGHLVRHERLALHGPAELVELLERLRAGVRPERVRRDLEADVEVMTVHRDASMYQAIPEDTWTLCFGWFMHSLFEMRHGFPLHRNLRPIFVSFHCNKRDLMTPEAVEYLKRYAPVGCRDWTTVYLLLSLGVPAFFSGCLTTTTDTLFRDLQEPPDPAAPLAYVDVPEDDRPAGAVAYRHSSEAVRERPFVANVHEALRLLETYRREHRGVVTSRLHCYLPMRSLGADVDFRPKNRSDIRFEGLIDISDDAFDAMRANLLAKLEVVLGAILDGHPEHEVYALWRDLNADDVAAAEARRREDEPLPQVAVRVKPVLARTVAHGQPADDAVHCAVVLRRDAGPALSVLGASLLEHASRPVHLWVLARAGTEADERTLADEVPGLSYTWVPTRGIARGIEVGAGGRLNPTGLVRLLVADLLPAVKRVLLLSLPAVATGDVAELAEFDLDGYALAAARRPAVQQRSGFGVIHAAAARLGDRNVAAATLRRMAHARHAFDFDAFAGEVLLLDLERLRRDAFAAYAVPLATEFGLDDLETMHFVFGPERATLPPQWAVVPTRTPSRAPGLMVWADRVKPWQPEITPERDRWRRYAAGFEA